MNNRNLYLPALILSLAGTAALHAQSEPGVLITVETRNYVIYWDDVGDPSRFATDPGLTTARRPQNFDRGIGVGDIVSVNGVPAKGTFNYSTSILAMNSIPTPGQAVVDSRSRGSHLMLSWDIQGADGTQIGTIWALGFAGPVPPPGAPRDGLAQNVTIVGGTGAFLGVRGQINSFMGTAASRSASVTEDPMNRHVYGGGGRRDLIHLIPAEAPRITSVLHADFSPVTDTNPARRGETLILAATGLGPVRAFQEPGQPFPASPVVEINSPIEAIVNGMTAPVLSGIGWPTRVGVYRVDVRVPESTTPGTATLRLSSAWIPTQEVRFPVRE